MAHRSSRAQHIGALALEAAAAGLPVDRIAVHEVPYLLGDEMLAAWRGYKTDLDAARVTQHLLFQR